MEANLRPFFKRRRLQSSQDQSKSGSTEDAKFEHKRQERRDADIIRRMWILIAFGLSIFLGGFGIWTLDNVYCSTLRGWRQEIGLPWGFVLEGHGWWHLMTGIGADCYIVWGIWLRHCINGRQDEFDMIWPSWFPLPRIERVAPAPNGSLKKRA